MTRGQRLAEGVTNPRTTASRRRLQRRYRLRRRPRRIAGAGGLIGYALNARLTHKEFWTVSVWESRDELERFAGADPHATIIRTKRERMAESKFVFWSCRGRDLPVRWGVVAEHLDAPVS